jgi:DNA-binding PadR family transcriptional regulator
MSVKFGLLGLLRVAPAHGYQLRAELLEATGATWSLNIGQVYSTLQRLERDGLIGADDTDDDDSAERRRYRITDKGAHELDMWLDEVVPHESGARSELVVKMAIALSLDGVDAPAVVDRQRAQTMATLQSLNRAKRKAESVQARLSVEWTLLQTEAEIRWLDLCEAALAERSGREGRR